VRSSTELERCLAHYAESGAVSLSAFQNVLGALIADRGFCSAVRQNPAVALTGHDLSAREASRLAAMAGARGMTASGTLYRLNRLAPLRRCLPRTLAALGPILPGLIDEFRRAYPETRLQFEEEVTRFTTFVGAQIAAGAPIPPLAADSLAFEAAACRLSFRIRDQAAVPAHDAARVRLDPSVAVVRLQMEPTAVFAGHAGTGSPGEYYVVLDARGPELKATAVPVAVGRILVMAVAGLAVADDAASRSARATGWLLN
jgi:hypothetical protein